MKTVKKGRSQKGWAKEFTCTGAGNDGGGCGAILLVEEGDLYQTAHHCFDGSADTYTTFQCGECGVETDIKEPPSLIYLPTKQAWQKKKEQESKVEAKEVPRFTGAKTTKDDNWDGECG